LIELKVQISLVSEIWPRDEVEPRALPGSGEFLKKPQLVEDSSVVQKESNRGYSYIYIYAYVSYAFLWHCYSPFLELIRSVDLVAMMTHEGAENRRR
jgi:hypothetical protein